MNKNVRPRWLTFKYFKAASAALEVNNCISLQGGATWQYHEHPHTYANSSMAQ